MAGKRLRLPGGTFLVGLISGTLGYALPGEEHPLLKGTALVVAAVALAVFVVLLITGIVRWWRARGAPADGLESQILNVILAEPNRPQTLEQLQAITGEAMKFVRAATEHLAAQGKVVYGKASVGGHGSARVTGAVKPAVPKESLRLQRRILEALEVLEGPMGAVGPIGIPVAALEGATGATGPALDSALSELTDQGKVERHGDRITRREIVYDEKGHVAGVETVYESGRRDAAIMPVPVHAGPSQQGADGAVPAGAAGPIIDITDPAVTKETLSGGAKPEPVWVARVTVGNSAISGDENAAVKVARAWLTYEPRGIRDLPGRWTRTREPTGPNAQLPHEELETTALYPGERQATSVNVVYENTASSLILQLAATSSFTSSASPSMTSSLALASDSAAM